MPDDTMPHAKTVLVRTKLLPREPHAPVLMWAGRHTDYVYKGYVGVFCCAVCGRQVRKHLNYLGWRVMMCDGLKTFAVPKQALPWEGER